MVGGRLREVVAHGAIDLKKKFGFQNYWTGYGEVDWELGPAIALASELVSFHSDLFTHCILEISIGN